MATKNSYNAIQQNQQLGIYVHIPFCNSKCLYCNFCSFVIEKSKQNNVYDRYVNAVIKQLILWAPRAVNYEVTTIYFGGGTPSILGQRLGEILKTIFQNYTVSPSAEISTEANPNAVTATDALAWKTAGFNRVSVGLQSGNDALLKMLGRTHTQNDFLRAIAILKTAGFENISADVMLGLPTQTVSDVENTLHLLFQQDLKHISCYSLILEEETPLYRQVLAGQVTLPSDDKTVKMYDVAVRLLDKNGFSRYEVSNFAKVGFACRHNQNTWNLTPYLGFGVAAHSYFEQIRFSAPQNLDSFISQIDRGVDPVLETQTMTQQDALEETIMLGLRTSQGIDLNAFEKRFGVNLLTQKKQTIETLVQQKFLSLENGRLFATNLGFHVLNNLILQLLP